MSHLTPREQALVSLGAAMGSNCKQCIEYHTPGSRKAGLSDAQISEAIGLADRLRQVPARKTLDTALDLLSASPRFASPVATCDKTAAARTDKPCCG